MGFRSLIFSYGEHITVIYGIRYFEVLLITSFGVSPVQTSKHHLHTLEAAMAMPSGRRRRPAV